MKTATTFLRILAVASSLCVAGAYGALANDFHGSGRSSSGGFHGGVRNGGGFHSEGFHGGFHGGGGFRGVGGYYGHWHGRRGWYPYGGVYGGAYCYSYPVYCYPSDSDYYDYSVPAPDYNVSPTVYNTPPATDVAPSAPSVADQTVAPAIPATSVADIEAMTKSQINDSIIISQIQNSHSVYHLTAAEIIGLKNSGVSEKVIEVMVNTPNS